MRSSRGVGRYSGTATTEKDIVSGPVVAFNQPNTHEGVIFAGGLGSEPDGNVSYDGFIRDVLTACQNNFPTVTADLAGLSVWANDATIARRVDARTYLQAAATGYKPQAKSGKVALVGASMGFAGHCAYARANLADVSCIVGVVGLTDMNALYSANRNGFAPAIDIAYGGTYSTVTNGPTHSPLAFASSLTIPILLFYADADTTVLPAESQAFGAAAPNCTLVQMSGTHTSFTKPSDFIDRIISFIKANP